MYADLWCLIQVLFPTGKLSEQRKLVVLKNICALCHKTGQITIKMHLYQLKFTEKSHFHKRQWYKTDMKGQNYQ